MDTPFFESDVDIDRLLASPTHVAWVRTLAARLVRDDTDRDDAVQDSLLATWVRRASIQFPRAFAAVYLRRAGAHAARGRSRRWARERAAMHADASADPARLVEEADLYALLIRKLAALDEPFRSALIQRYVDDLEPHEIARRAGVPAATIRSRVQRGLEKLRAELDAAHGGDRDTWVRAFIVLLPARIGATALVATPLAAGLVVFAAYLLADEPMPERIDSGASIASVAGTADDATTPDSVSGAHSVAADATAELAQRVMREAMSDASTNAQPEPDIRVHHVVACAIGGRAIAGARVSLVASAKARDGEIVGSGVLTTTFADADGRATVTFDEDMIDVADRAIRIDPLGYLPRTFEIEESIAEQRMPLYEAGSLRVVCAVVDSMGQPVSMARVSNATTEGLDARTDAGGRFEMSLRTEAAKPRLRVRAPGAMSEFAVLGPAADSGPRLVPLSRARELKIAAVDAQSKTPIAGAAWSEVMGIEFHGPDTFDVIATADGAGVAALQIPVALDPLGRTTCLIVRANGYASAYVNLTDDSVTTLKVALDRATAVRGVVVDAATHAPLPRARVLLRAIPIRTVRDKSVEPSQVEVRASALFPEQGVVVRADESGRFHKEDLPPVADLLATLVGDARYESSMTVGVLGPSGAAPLVIEIAARAKENAAAGKVAGVMSFNGTPGPMPFKWSRGNRSGSGHADADGRYVIDRLEPGKLNLTTFVPGIVDRKDSIEVHAGVTSNVDVAVRSPLANVAGRVLYADGSVAQFMTLTFSRAAQEGLAVRAPSQALTDAQGRFEAWLPIDAKTAITVLPAVKGLTKTFPAVAGDDRILIVLP